MEHMQDMFSKMGLGKNAKMNVSAMESQMQQNLKMAQMKERMKKKAESQQVTKQPDTHIEQQKNSLSDDQLAQMFDNAKDTKDTKDKKKKNKTKK